MKNSLVIWMLVGLAFAWIPKKSYAQVILVGCTVSVTGQPTTTSRIVDVNLNTGAAANPRDTGIYALAGIAVNPLTGIVFGLTTSPTPSPSNSLVQIDINSGSYTLVGNTGLPGIVEGDLSFNPIDGLLYGMQDVGLSGTQRNLFRMDPTTGFATVIGNVTTPPADYSAIAFNSSGTLYAINTSGSGNSLLQTIDPTTAQITSSLTMNFNLGTAAALAFHPFNGTAYVGNGEEGSVTNQLYSLNVGTGELSAIGPLGSTEGLTGLCFVSVPEPSSIVTTALVLLSYVGMKFQVRLKNRRHAIDRRSSR